MLSRAEDEIRHVVIQFASDQDIRTRHVRTSISYLELDVDIRADPYRYLAHIDLPFRSRFKRVIHSRYRNTAFSYLEQDGEYLALKGFYRSGYTVKAYAKGPHRIRFEATFDGKQVRRHWQRLPSRSEHVFGDLSRLFASLASSTADNLNHVLLAAAPLAPGASVWTTLDAIASAVPSHDTRDRVMSQLIAMGHVSRSQSAVDVRRLVRAGVLEPTDRGVYVPTSQYAHAIEQIRSTSGRPLGVL